MSDEPSPFEPPKSSINQNEKPLEVIPASKWLRLANLFIDYIAFMIFGAFVGF